MSDKKKVLVFRELPDDQLARLTAVHDVTVANPRIAAQKAAFDSSGDEGAAATYLPRSTPYQLHRARAASAPEGNGYMLLIRPDGSRYMQPVAAPQAR